MQRQVFDRPPEPRGRTAVLPFWCASIRRSVERSNRGPDTAPEGVQPSWAVQHFPHGLEPPTAVGEPRTATASLRGPVRVSGVGVAEEPV
jgi:hypothetical protein